MIKPCHRHQFLGQRKINRLCLTGGERTERDPMIMLLSQMGNLAYPCAKNKARNTDSLGVCLISLSVAAWIVNGDSLLMTISMAPADSSGCLYQGSGFGGLALSVSPQRQMP